MEVFVRIFCLSLAMSDGAEGDSTVMGIRTDNSGGFAWVIGMDSLGGETTGID